MDQIQHIARLASGGGEKLHFTPYGAWSGVGTRTERFPYGDTSCTRGCLRSSMYLGPWVCSFDTSCSSCIGGENEVQYWSEMPLPCSGLPMKSSRLFQLLRTPIRYYLGLDSPLHVTTFLPLPIWLKVTVVLGVSGVLGVTNEAYKLAVGVSPEDLVSLSHRDCIHVTCI